MAKEFARAFYSSKRWQDCRDSYARQRNYLCEDCLARGLIVPGVIVHHIKPLTPANIETPEIALSTSNLCLLCRNCHEKKHHHTSGWNAVNKRKRDASRAADRFVIDKNGKVSAR